MAFYSCDDVPVHDAQLVCEHGVGPHAFQVHDDAQLVCEHDVVPRAFQVHDDVQLVCEHGVVPHAFQVRDDVQLVCERGAVPHDAQASLDVQVSVHDVLALTFCDAYVCDVSYDASFSCASSVLFSPSELLVSLL
jgi:hypothetical protein